MKMAIVNEANAEFNTVVSDLDKKLDAVLKQQEQQYLQGYAVYVREKETELRTLVQKLNDRNANSGLKDEIILWLNILTLCWLTLLWLWPGCRSRRKSTAGSSYGNSCLAALRHWKKMTAA